MWKGGGGGVEGKGGGVKREGGGVEGEERRWRERRGKEVDMYEGVWNT